MVMISKEGNALLPWFWNRVKLWNIPQMYVSYWFVTINCDFINYGTIVNILKLILKNICNYFWFVYKRKADHNIIISCCYCFMECSKWISTYSDVYVSFIFVNGCDGLHVSELLAFLESLDGILLMSEILYW